MKKVNKFKYKRVKIYWQDIVSCSEWMTLEKANDLKSKSVKELGAQEVKIRNTFS